MINQYKKTKRNTIIYLVIFVIAFFIFSHFFLNYQFEKIIVEKNVELLSIVNELEEVYFELVAILMLLVALFFASIMYFVKNSVNALIDDFKEQTFDDDLTGLGNRERLNDDIVNNEINILILGNIKEFSLINEFYGISSGNDVLKTIANEFNDFAEENAFKAYRISSDEFALLKHDESFCEDDYLDILEELHAKINALQIEIKEFSDVLQVEMYLGVSNGDTNLVEKSQMALKTAREKSLPFVAYTENVDTKNSSIKTIKMKKTLKHALDNNKVIPFFQEIRDREKNIVKYEALVRIVDFEDGKEKILYPNDFLSIAQNGGLYVYLAKEVLSQSLTFFANRDEKISINFLPNDFFQPKVIDAFLEIVEKFENPKRIIIELTEQENVEDFNRLLKVVKKLRKLGVGIAIDDFGSGYANYSHVLKLKPDYLKIDGSLVQNILENDESKILVKSIVRFAQDLGIKTTAEYVENEAIFDLLKEYGVDEFQGYFFGKAENLLNDTTN